MNKISDILFCVCYKRKFVQTENSAILSIFRIEIDLKHPKSAETLIIRVLFQCLVPLWVF